MSNLLIIGEQLNEVVFERDNFFRDLISEAYKLSIITESEGVYIRDKIQEAITERTMDVLDELAFGFESIEEVLVPNYMYLISRYIFSMKPLVALKYLNDTAGNIILAKAIRNFEKEISNKYLELESFINTKMFGKGSATYKATAREILAQFKNLLSFEENLSVEFTTKNFFMVYHTLDYFEIMGMNIVDAALKYADSFMIEYSIRSKVGINIIKHIKFDNNKEARITKELIEIKYQEEERAILANIEKEISNRRKNGEIVSERQKSDMIDIALNDLEERYSESNVSEFEFENTLVDTFVEFVCILLKMDNPEKDIPKKISDKRNLIRKIDQKLFFEKIFSHEEIFSFNNKEKEFLIKNFFSNL